MNNPKCIKCGSENKLYTNRYYTTGGICLTCLNILKNQQTDSNGYCYFFFTDSDRQPCDENIHYTHSNNLMFEKNIGICQHHVVKGLQYFAEKETQRTKPKPLPKPQPKPAPAQLSLF